MRRLPGERTDLRIAEGPFAGLSAEVEALTVWPIRQTIVRAVNVFYAAEGPDAEVLALSEFYALFVSEAQPTWTLADHRGPIPPTAEGMWRLPLALALAFVDLWVSPPTSAVDELIPPGSVRDELNRALKAKRKV